MPCSVSEFVTADIAPHSLRLHPPGAYMDRVAVKDDIVPLLHPITTPSGEKLTSLKIKSGQVRLLTSSSYLVPPFL